MLGLDDVAAGEDGGALDDVLQLADVAGPGVGLELGLGLGREGGGRPGVALRVLAEEVLGQEAHVAEALAERGHADGEDGEPEGGALGITSPPSQASSRVGVRETMTRTSTGMDSVAPTRSTSPSESTRSSRPWSEGERAAGSSRKMVPLWASSKRPARSSKAPSKAPRFHPKKLALQRVAAEGGAGHLDEGVLLAGRADVDGAGHDLLLGAGLALDEDRRRGGGAQGDALREAVLGGGALAGDLPEVDRVALLALEVAGVVGELVAEPPVLAHGGEGRDRLAEDDGELLRVPRLLEVALDRAGVEGVDEHGEIGVRRRRMPTVSGRLSRASLRNSTPLIPGIR